jgi:alkylation response protein AidB-like acyl-CoA dehydrogenase
VKFSLSEDQELLRSATADMLASESPIDVSRQISEAGDEGFAREHWSKLAELGYLGLLAPESVGGQGLGPVELALVCSEMGKVCFPGPYLDVVIAAKMLEAAGGHDDLLRKIVAGEAIVVSAEVDRIWPNQSSKVSFGEDRVSGTKYFVAFGASADALVVAAGPATVLVDAPFDTVKMDTLDEGARFAALNLDNPAAEIGGTELFDDIRDLRAVGAAAQALGICERTLASAVEYSSQRETFGKPIGVYQVLQHRMADMLLRTESTRSIVMRAAWCLANDALNATLVASAAKQFAVESANQITRDTLQIHGGNGFTWEYDLHFYLKRAITLAENYGSNDELLERALTAYEAEAFPD